MTKKRHKKIIKKLKKDDKKVLTGTQKECII